MNAISPIMPADCWDETTRAVNLWRGQALDEFARVERAVSETLAAMAASQCRKAVKLRPLIGQRYDDLRAAVGADGPFAAAGTKAAAALTAFQPSEMVRHYLCHGVAKVWIDRHGDWLVVLKLLAFERGQAVRSDLAYDRKAAEVMLADLHRQRVVLEAALQSLRARVAR